MKSHRRGFTLVEILVVLVLFAVGIGLFNVIFVNNWLAYEERIARVDLLNEANQIIDELSFNSRNSNIVTTTADANTKTVKLTLADNNATEITYTLDSDGQARVTQNQKTKIFTDKIDFANSTFEREGKNLRIHLTVRDHVIGQRWISVSVDSEVLLRN